MNKFQFDHVYVDSKYVTQDIMIRAKESQCVNDSLLVMAAKKNKMKYGFTGCLMYGLGVNSIRMVRARGLACQVLEVSFGIITASGFEIWLKYWLLFDYDC